MAQASIYLDGTTMGFAQSQAKSLNVSLSKYIGNLIRGDKAKRQWPKTFFDTFGALSEDDIQEPAELGWELDEARWKAWE